MFFLPLVYLIIFYRISCFDLKYTLTGPNGTVRCLYPLENDFLASGSDDYVFRVWNLRKREIRDSFSGENGGHSGQIRDIIELGKNYLSTASLDGSIKIWKIKKNETVLINTFDSSNGGHMKEVVKLAISNNYLVSCSTDKTVKIWNIENLDKIKLKYTLDESKHGHTDFVFSAISIGNNQIATCSKEIKIWNLNNGSLRFTFDSSNSVFDDAINYLIRNKNHLIASSSSTNLSIGGIIKVFDLTKLKLKWTFDRSNGGHDSYIFDLINLGDSDKIASASGDKTIKIWNIISGKLEKTLQGHIDEVWVLGFYGNSLLFSGAGNFNGTTSELNLWDLENGLIKRSFNQNNGGHKKRIYSMVFLENGHLVTGSVDHTIKIWNINQASDFQTANLKVYFFICILSFLLS